MPDGSWVIQRLRAVEYTRAVWISLFPQRTDQTVIDTSPMWYAFDMGEGVGVQARNIGPLHRRRKGAKSCRADISDLSHLGLLISNSVEPSQAVNQSCQPSAFFPRTDHLLPTPPIPDLPTSSLPWTLPQPSAFDHEFCLFPPGYAPARLCGSTAPHWTS
ncbi:unnamed protein product [Pleuronectes platessa]|uniref:Uncharacterized protein n=1 Tax=Pleuronectes platessa TaxID=8262 RepID=A0A9N7YK60_PLEPL|nr:unnamed protein product [Pleuronectes platessa]